MIFAFFNDGKIVKKSKIGMLAVVLISNITLRLMLEFLIIFSVRLIMHKHS
jgi:hypothetical protein